jgi:hypothetical protein
VKKTKRIAAICALLIVIAASVTFTVHSIREVLASRDHRLNVLVLSMCSFRYQELQFYGHKGESVAPEIDDFFANSSFVFENAVNGVNWIGIFAYTEGFIQNSELADLGYHLLSPYYGRHILRIPDRRSNITGDPEDFDDNDFEKDHAQSTAYLESMATTPVFSPFFVIAHYKYLHYPLIDTINPNSQWDYYLNDKDRKYLDHFLHNVAKYPAKLPLALMLTADTKAIATNPEVQRSGMAKDKSELKRFGGLITNPEFIARWQASPGFQSDVDLINKIYDGNLRYISKVLGRALNLWNDPDLQRKTVVVLVGDHGEMHMEHGQLTHATALYETAIKTPLAIRFPGHEGKPVVIKEPMQFKMLGTLLGDIIRGKVNEDNLEGHIKAIQDDTLILRDCANTQRGLRYKNQYKYIVQMADGSRELYDLTTDPNELKNIATESPRIVDQMESLYWENYQRFTDIRTYICPGWITGDNQE